MNLLKSLAASVSGALSLSNDFTVVEINRDVIARCEVLATDDRLKLYKIHDRETKYALVLTIPGSVPKYLRLFILKDWQESSELFSLYVSRVVPIVAVCTSAFSRLSKLQDLCNTVRQHRFDSVLHHCVKLGLRDAIKKRHPEIARNVNAVDEDNCTPLHKACESRDVSDDIVQELVNLGADIGLQNAHNETALHFATKYSPSKLKILLSQPTEAVNLTSICGETPVHIACIENQPECLKLLLQHGANPTLSESYQLPIHCAVKAGNTECIKVLAECQSSLLAIKDHKFGGTALHWAETAEMVDCLLDCGAPVNALSNTRDTPLHIMLKKDRRCCVNALLTGGADVTMPNHEGETPLHIAIPTDDLAMVRSLVVFGADVNMVDRNGNSPRHMTSTLKSKNSAAILYTLHMVGAARCAPGRKGCTDGCAQNGKDIGKVVSDISSQKIKIDDACDELMTAVSMSHMPPDGYRVLCLDGGGIRGLILSMILIQLEKMSGCRIRDSFDWISGTSTGGILALALTTGRNARYCLGLYMRLKNKVFCGSKPYSEEVLEKILKDEFGEHTLMSELPEPRVLVTAVLADRFPPDLHLFRNYENPLHACLPKEDTDKYSPPPAHNEICVWQAARSSGAAPTFFKPSMGRFLDGGLMSNNPTLDTLTEIQEFNAGLRCLGHHDQVRPLKCVVSLGTGRPPQKCVNDIAFHMPSGISEVVKVFHGAGSLFKMLVEQATQSEGRPNERARAWCSMINVPFFRLSPQLSVEVELDETNDDTLLLVCWETMVYLHQNEEKLVRIANILNAGSSGNKSYI